MLVRYSKLEKKRLSDGAVPSNLGAKFWPWIGILGRVVVMFSNVEGGVGWIGVMVLSGVSEDKGVKVFDKVSSNGKPGLVFDLLSEKSDATVGSGVV
jgi:hypothetical protein